MHPSTIALLCLCGSRALVPPPPVITQRHRCSHSATPRGFGSTPTKTKKKKAKREGLFRVELRHADGIGTALGASAAAVGWESDTNEATRTDVAGVAGAFLIHNALTPRECEWLTFFNRFAEGMLHLDVAWPSAPLLHLHDVATGECIACAKLDANAGAPAAAEHAAESGRV